MFALFNFTVAMIMYPEFVQAGLILYIRLNCVCGKH